MNSMYIEEYFKTTFSTKSLGVLGDTDNVRMRSWQNSFVHCLIFQATASFSSGLIF